MTKYRNFKDQLGRSTIAPLNPSRIISLVPSQTELLFSLGLKEKLVGRTKFCTHPKSGVKEIPVIGGTKNFRYDVIDQLQPDLIIANKEENYREGIEQLSSNYPVWTSDISTFTDAIEMISSIGVLTNTGDRALIMIKDIKEAWDNLPDFNGSSVIYLIWKDPFMAAGKDTFINSVMQKLKLSNTTDKDRYPEISLELSGQPDYVFLSSEPYPFKEKHIPKIQRFFPKSQICLVDGEYFSWYGSRLMLAPKYFHELYHTIKTRNKPRA